MLAINVLIPNLKIARLVQFWPWQFDVFNKQQTWMLTLGLLNRNTGCQCCSVRCSSVSERHLGFLKVETFNLRSGSEAQYASSLSPRRSWQRDIACYYVKNRKIPPPLRINYRVDLRHYLTDPYEIWWTYKLIITDEHYGFRFSFHITSDGA